MEKIICEYPRDLITFFAKKKDGTHTLNVESHLSRANVKDGDSPYHNFNAFSRFKFTHLTPSGQFYTGNIKPMDDVPDITKRTEFANRRIYEFELSQNTSARSENGEKLDSPAYTVRFFSGKYKGMTPAEILTKAPVNGKQILNKQKEWLEANLAQYRSNQTQIDAIDDALTRLEQGTLHKVEQGASGTAITILKKSMHPNMYKEKKYDKNFVYEIGITCYPENNYPYVVSIENYYATVEKKKDGTLNVLKSDTAQDLVNVDFYLSVKDWNTLIQAINTNMRQYENAIAVTQFRDADTADEENRKAAANSKASENKAVG